MGTTGAGRANSPSRAVTRSPGRAGAGVRAGAGAIVSVGGPIVTDTWSGIVQLAAFILAESPGNWALNSGVADDEDGCAPGPDGPPEDGTRSPDFGFDPSFIDVDLDGILPAVGRRGRRSCWAQRRRSLRASGRDALRSTAFSASDRDRPGRSTDGQRTNTCPTSAGASPSTLV